MRAKMSSTCCRTRISGCTRPSGHRPRRQRDVDGAGRLARGLERRALLVERRFDFGLERVDELAELAPLFGGERAETSSGGR